MEIDSKELVATKIPHKQMQKDMKKEIGIKPTKQAKVNEFKNQKIKT